MINKVTKKELPDLFKGIHEFHIADGKFEHRRGSSFFREFIISIVPEHSEFFPTIKNFYEYVGCWKTNEWIWDENDSNFEDIDTLTRICLTKEYVETSKWVEIGDMNIVNTDRMIIEKTEYLKLKEDSDFMRCLEAAGVDNWEGYSIAQDIYERDYSNDSTLY